MEELLYLAHRIPYPPNKGDKIVSYNLLTRLVRRYRVHLGGFIDDPVDWEHVDRLDRLCNGETHWVGLDPRRARLGSLRGLLCGAPLSVEYYRNAGFTRWVRDVVQHHGIRRALVFSGAMARFVTDLPQLRRVVDFVDVDSDKWLQYARNKRWPMSWVYRREGETLLRYERRVAAGADAVAFISEREAELFRHLAPEVADKVSALVIGVDASAYDPGRDWPNPYPADERVLVFTGAMDYWANVDAITWFAREVFPRVRAVVSDARLYVVGARPSDAVQQLAELPGVTVTGRVADIQPYMAHATAAVAPLRIARGIQNKVLEAMAMGRPVLATPAAMDGIRPLPGQEQLVADEPARLAEKAVALLRDGAFAEMGGKGRRFVIDNYDWDTNTARLFDMLEGTP